MLGGAALVAPAADAGTIGILFKDANFNGTSYGMGGNADCDSSGYTYSWSTWSNFHATSSIGGWYSAPHCNTVKMWTDYGAQGICYLPCNYVGDWANDRIVTIQIYRRSGT